jgi:hypothetical protein
MADLLMVAMAILSFFHSNHNWTPCLMVDLLMVATALSFFHSNHPLVINQQTIIKLDAMFDKCLMTRPDDFLIVDGCYGTNHTITVES